MAPRAQWNGYLRLSLVSCAVSLYPAISPAERVAFRQVNRETGNRLRQQLVDTVTGKVVDSHIRPLDLPNEIIDVTQLILNTKREHFDSTYLEDRYRTVLVEKLREKTAKIPASGPSARPSVQNVINLMDALKASLSAAKPPAPSKGREVSGKRSQSAPSTSAKTGRSKRTG